MQPLMVSFLSICLTMFLLLDPIGNIPVFSSMLKTFPAKKQRYIIIREHIIAFAVILFFSFIGESMLKLLKINPHIVNVSGGTILFLIAIKMIFPSEKKDDVNHIKEEPLIVPLAIPLIAGPAALATGMIYFRTVSAYLLMGGVMIALLLSMCILIAIPLLQKIFGTKFLQALERLMGMVLVLMAFEMFFEGIKGFFLT